MYRVKGTEMFWNDPDGAEAILQVRAAALCDHDRPVRHLRTRPGCPFTRRPKLPKPARHEIRSWRAPPAITRPALFSRSCRARVAHVRESSGGPTDRRLSSSRWAATVAIPPRRNARGASDRDRLCGVPPSRRSPVDAGPTASSRPCRLCDSGIAFFRPSANNAALLQARHPARGNAADGGSRTDARAGRRIHPRPGLSRGTGDRRFRADSGSESEARRADRPRAK